MRARRRIVPLPLALIGLLLTQCQGPSPAVALPRWQWPVPENHSIANPYRAPLSAFGAGHRGIDVLVAGGSAIVAPTAATVAVAQRVVDRDVVTLRVDGNWLISFDGATSTVPAGVAVTAGQTVATVAPTPHCSCVHVGVRYRGEYVNPLLLWGDVPRAVLLPW